MEPGVFVIIIPQVSVPAGDPGRVFLVMELEVFDV